jgi:hypothetical protein
MTEEVIVHLAPAALPLATDVLGAPLAHAREIGDEVVDGLRGHVDLDTGFTMHAPLGEKGGDFYPFPESERGEAKALASR